MGRVGWGVASPAWSLIAIHTEGALYYLGLGMLVGLMIWGAILAHRSWEEATEDLGPASRDELLDVFEQARADGELDEAEFARIRRRIERGDRPPPA